VGPFKINLADLKWSRDLQNELDKIPALFTTLAVFFIIGAGCAGVAMLSSAAGLVTYSKSPRFTVLNNVGWAGLSALALFVGSMVVTIGGKKAADAVNEYGDDVGLVASRGSKFLAIAWTAFAAMAVAACYWAYEYVFRGPLPSYRLGGCVCVAANASSQAVRSHQGAEEGIASQQVH